jgi:hypothetical protein
VRTDGKGQRRQPVFAPLPFARSVCSRSHIDRDKHATFLNPHGANAGVDWLIAADELRATFLSHIAQCLAHAVLPLRRKTGEVLPAARRRSIFRTILRANHDRGNRVVTGGEQPEFIDNNSPARPLIPETFDSVIDHSARVYGI